MSRAPNGPERARRPPSKAVAPEPLPPLLLEDSVGYLVRRTFRGFTRSLEDRLKAYDLSASLWFFLRLLWESDGRTQKEISEELGLTPPTTVNAMDVLADRGYIYRSRNKDDRRKVNIFLSKAGRELAREIAPYAAEVNRVGLRDLSTEEQDTLRDLLRRVERSLHADHSG